MKAPIQSSTIGMNGLTFKVAGAIATELSHGALKVNPFIPIVLLWIGAFIRDRSIFF